MNDIACLNYPSSNWSNIVLNIGKGMLCMSELPQLQLEQYSFEHWKRYAMQKLKCNVLNLVQSKKST